MLPKTPALCLRSNTTPTDRLASQTTRCSVPRSRVAPVQTYATLSFISACVDCSTQERISKVARLPQGSGRASVCAPRIRVQLHGMYLLPSYPNSASLTNHAYRNVVSVALSMLTMRLVFVCAGHVGRKGTFPINAHPLPAHPPVGSFRVETGGKLAYASGLYYDPDLTKIVMNLLPAAPHEKPRMAWDRPVTTMALQPGAGNTPAAVAQGEHSPFHRTQFLSLVDEYRKLCAGESTGSLKQFIVLNRTRTITRLKVCVTRPRSQ